ncbi:ABC transporter [Scheffersomyces stipitis CBS 6054]|uniref:ABC transporter n=1 Tax=Scheffersomyces stipitis (strain ATCC 58785 / CBS 6054 / NBRC 10063 / NRRL Y-11545) TaxID=322104 RepID=A3LUN9_PICST|nr:ABC transporter [Scheffersomyces stipitis CBS 6054]ABN66626.2 ABC transporter [Scheffersomyces stipitis CBS 6054]KAG2732713.1 hypothetical protein G9P44_003703 [Scheffersomyces stipitis]
MSTPTMTDDSSQEAHASDRTEFNQYDGFNQVVENEIRELARNPSRISVDTASLHSSSLALVRTLTNASQIPGQNPMVENSSEYIDPRLDPCSEQFDSKFWVQNLRKLVLSDAEYYKPASLGLAYKNLRAYGLDVDTDYQTTFGNGIFKMLNRYARRITGKESSYDILKPMDGILLPGELTVVLGRPGAGCTTLLKTLSTQTYGFQVDKESIISYDGFTPSDIKKHYRGDVVYCSETEKHFPHLTVWDTLYLAAKLRTPQNRPLGVSRELYANHMTEVVLATYGLTNTKYTKVGDDFVRGVSGGERKRVSIAEVALNSALIQCWDNSTRGLDAATALEFVRALKASAQVSKATPLVAIYQCSQDGYDLFDKVILMYEGYQIFFGNAKKAKQYFIDMGYECPQRQTTADFLTSLTNPAERIPRKGYEAQVPRTPEEFYNYWQKSPQRQELLSQIDSYLNEHLESNSRSEFHESHIAKQARHTNPGSSYTVSFLMQVRYVVERNILRTKGDPSFMLFQIGGNIFIAFILCSIFYNLQPTTESFYSRTAAMFFAILFNANSSMLEIFSLYEARSVVEKHKTYALYHPAADAIGSIITELPTKIITCIGFNLVYYFMIHFRREPGHFFFYLLVNFTATLAMSHLFRSIGASTKTMSQAMTPSVILLLAFVIFTGFIIPTPDMHGWCRWINYINPIAYAFEALIANEFHDRDFICSRFVPSGGSYPVDGPYRICSVVGSVVGENYVNGDAFINESFKYYDGHKWRNWGIVLAFAIFFMFTYVLICEYNRGSRQKGEVLLFQKRLSKRKMDMEMGKMVKYTHEFSSDSSFEKNSKHEYSGNIFHWRHLSYSVKIKSENRIILDDIDGWVKPGQITALMGATGAGKTTLLNAISDRLTAGVVTDGVRMVNGRPLDADFQRSVGYVQQQDLHLETSTVKEALKFSAYLRQPYAVSKKEKDEYVDYVINLLDMESYSDAVVGISGEGLNVEQRKRLSIGVELVAKPKLLLFLDEPTSGLDSQTAWSICKLIRKLADSGQAIVCTIHQPSAILLKEFDRLLFLQKGGQTVYFGDLGDYFNTLIQYFEKHGAHKCPPEANPAEWMLEVIGAAPGSHSKKDYAKVWKDSEEYKQIQRELDEMERELVKLPVNDDPEKLKTFTNPMWKQYVLVTERVLQQYWRTPSYTYNKVTLSVLSSLFNGFAFFKADRSLQGLQNQMFSVFMFLVNLMTLVQQYLPHFVAQRDLYEVRERPSRTFSWFAFIAAQITSEVPWNIFCGTLSFLSWYYPVGFYQNAVETNTVHQRGGYMWFAIVMFYVYSSTMGQMCMSFMELADNATNLCIIMYSMCLGFCGVLVTKQNLPGFWIFMYRANPFTYLVSVILSTGLFDTKVTCSPTEILNIPVPQGYTCEQFMGPYMSVAGGYLQSNGGQCQFCTMANTNVFLNSINADYYTRYRDMGLFVAFIGINVICTVFFYWLARVPKFNRRGTKT